MALILAALFISPRLAEPTYGLAAGVLVGGVLQIAIQVPQLRRLRAVGPARRSAGSDPAVRSVLLLMSPRLFAYGINTINTVVATRFAAGLGDASVSHLYYANRLKELVLGGFAVSRGDRDPAAAVPAGARGRPRSRSRRASPSRCG